MKTGHLYDVPNSPLTSESFDTLVEGPGCTLERIVSTGQATPPGEWLAQSWDEWVVLLRGGATLRFEAEAAPMAMRPGDWVLIPGGARHRVEETDGGQPTVWLALHVRGWRRRRVRKP